MAPVRDTLQIPQAERTLLCDRESLGERMPVTAKLSKKFYDTLGEDVANELVDWFNQVGATYRSELRDLNALNFARFDAKLEQRIAEVKADIVVLQETLESRFDWLNHKIDAQIDAINGKMDAHAESLRGYVDSRIDSLRAELIKWMFLFWLGTVATMLGFLSLIP